MIKAWDKAPYFSVKDVENNDISLHDYKDSFVLLSFYRYASCPLCNLRVHETIKENKKRNDLKFLAVFQSPKNKIAEYVGKQELSFPIIANPAKDLYELYKVELSWVGFARAWIFQLPRIFKSVVIKGFLPGSMENGAHQLPADFLIGPKGEIVSAYYGKDISDHMSFDKIDEAINGYNF